MISHSGPISGVACWRDTYIATAGYDNRVILWDAGSEKPIARANHDHLANQCAFTRDGRHLVTASSDYTARIWQLPSLRLVAVLGGHDDDVEMAVPHPSRPWVATASRDHMVRVFDFNGQLLRLFEGHAADVISVEWLAERDEVISSSDDGTIRRWSMTDGTLVDEIDMDGVETDTIALNADGTIYAGNDAGQIVVVQGVARHSVQAHAAGIKRLVLDAPSHRLLSLSYDRTARLWDVTEAFPSSLATWELPADIWPRSCAFAGDGTLVFATFGDRFRRYDPSTRCWAPEAAATPGLNAVAPSALGRGAHLAIGDAGAVKQQSSGDGVWSMHIELGSLCNFLTPVPQAVLTGGQLGILFDALTGRRIHQHRSPLNCGTAFRKDGVPHALIGTYTGEGLVLRLEDDAWVVVAELRLLGNAVKGVAASHNTLFAVGADRSATWWNIATLQPRRTLPGAHDRIANGCVWVHDETFASVSRDLTLRLWTRDKQPELIATPHEHSVKTVATLREHGLGRATAICTGSYDGSVAILDLRTRRWTTFTRPTTSGIRSVAADQLNRTFVASSYDGRLYEIASPSEAQAPTDGSPLGAVVATAGRR